MIESKANSKIKYIEKLLKNSRNRRKEGAFVVEGWKMCEEAIRHNLAKEILVSESGEKVWDEKMQGVSTKDISYDVVEEKLFNSLANTVTPQGVMATVKMPKYELSGKEDKLICLDDLQDPGNLGTIMRTAEGAGMSAVVMSKGTVDLFNPKVVRSTMGSMFRVPFIIVDNLAEFLVKKKSEGYKSYATYLQGSVDFKEPSYEGKSIVVIGNEANGISDEVATACDVKIRIPMAGEVESLNASVAAALLMYEMNR